TEGFSDFAVSTFLALAIDACHLKNDRVRVVHARFRPNLHLSVWRERISLLDEEQPANDSCSCSVNAALVQFYRKAHRHAVCGSADDTKSSMTSTRHYTCTLARRLPTVYAGRLFLSWRCWSGCRKRL